MTITRAQCSCGVVEIQLNGEPLLQYVCHCDDCQGMHGKAYSVALYPASAVSVTHGAPIAVTLKTTPRSKCGQCGTYLFAEVPGQPYRGVNGEILPNAKFKPEFHVQCQFVAAQINDNLPHYKDTPVTFRGSGELMPW